MPNSARVTATGQAVTGPCQIITARVCAGSGAAASLSIYNGTGVEAGSVNEVVFLQAPAGTDAESEFNVFLPGGAWAVLAGANARAFVNTI